MLQQRLEEVERRIRAAAGRAGRSREEITIIAVTKKFPASALREAYEIGLRHFGENYVQEFDQKAPEVSDLAGAEFHLIGHLQSNKARKAADLFSSVDTVDSARLANRLDQMDKRMDIMLEVKLSDEQAKSGAAPEELPAIIAAVRSAKNLNLAGLMTMPPWSDDPEPSRPYFRRLRELAELHGLHGLSMGMSHDLESAVEEGATHVRIGTALFGPRRKE